VQDDPTLSKCVTADAGAELPAAVARVLPDLQPSPLTHHNGLGRRLPPLRRPSVGRSRPVRQAGRFDTDGYQSAQCAETPASSPRECHSPPLAIVSIGSVVTMLT
jgi:hypothetical protein